jgi:AcrR family transcriptional regulator
MGQDDRSGDGRASRWAGHREQRRSELVDSAVEAIAQCGPQTTIEQIAQRAGVTRTKLYRFFDGAPDLRQAIAHRVAATLTAELVPLWQPDGSPAQMIGAAVGAYVHWLAANTNLYLYLDRHAERGDAEAAGTINAVRTSIGTHLATIFAAHLSSFDLDSMPAQLLAFGVIGFVESGTRRWLHAPDGYSEAVLNHQLSQWIWLLLDGTLRDRGIVLDPNDRLEQPSSPLAPPAQRTTVSHRVAPSTKRTKAPPV